MITLKIICAILAGSLCLSLGIFALWRNPKNRLNQSFALFNFFNAAWNYSAFFTFLDLWVPHPTALALYRPLQISGPATFFFLVCFVQDLYGIEDRPADRFFRRLLGAIVLLYFPFHFGPWVVRDFIPWPEFIEVPGPLSGVGIVLLLTGLIGVAVTSAIEFRRAQGTFRNQVKFSMFASVLGFMGIAFYALSFFGYDWPWAYFGCEVGWSYCYAYIIYKHRLFDFSLWLRRAAIYAGIYLFLLAVPFFAYPFFSGMIIEDPARPFWMLPLLVAAYGGLFSFAPGLTAYLKDRAESKEWRELHLQLEVMRVTSEKITTERDLSHAEISRRIAGSLDGFYRTWIKKPLSSILVFTVRQDGEVFFSGRPNHSLDVGGLKELKAALDAARATVEKTPLRVDLEKLPREGADASEDRLAALRRTMSTIGAEVCVPCHRNDRLFGGILLGAKQDGVFSQDELQTLQVVASYVALAVWNEELANRTHELTELDRLKKDLIANITHEFKSPLAVVESAVTGLFDDIQHDRLKKEDAADYLDMMKISTRQLGLYVQNLLDVAKIEQAKLVLSPERCDLSQLVNESSRWLAPLAKDKRLSFHISPAPAIEAVVDAEKIRQVVSNVVSNAIKFTDEGEVRVDLMAEEGRAMIRVRDTGRGISRDNLETIFDRFFRVAVSSQDRKYGTGLGLAISKLWTEAHGGRIWAESEGVGHGTTFKIEIPTAGAA